MDYYVLDYGTEGKGMSSLSQDGFNKDMLYIFLRGTAYHIRCNHCNAELALIKEPVPFKWCPLVGYMSTVIPAVYFLFVRKLGFVESMLYAAIIGLLAVVTIAILTIERCYFKVV